MTVKTCIGEPNQVAVEAALRATRLVARDQNNSLTRRVEGESDPPDTTASPKPKLFHIGMLRSMKGVCMRSAEMGPRSLSAWSIASSSRRTCPSKLSNSASNASSKMTFQAVI